MKAFAKRCFKEMLRDPLTLFFGALFPVVLLGFFSLVLANVPVETFKLHNLAPAIAVFSFSFLTLFIAQLIAKDRSSALMTRLLASPLKSADFLLGYFLPLLPIALMQGTVCLLFGVVFGLPVNLGLVYGLMALLLVSTLYSGVGLLMGAAFTEKQAGGFFTLFVNLTTWLSGTWFELSMVGGVFETVADLLPFAHAVNAVRAAMAMDVAAAAGELVWVLAYAAVVWLAAVPVFTQKTKG